MYYTSSIVHFVYRMSGQKPNKIAQEFFLINFIVNGIVNMRKLYFL